MKVLIFVGKGGVGKSTSSALFAFKLAKSGKKVILNSIDPAHNLHDIFQLPLGSKPKQILPNLSALETDLNRWVKKYLKSTEEEFKSVYKYQEAFNLHKYFKTLKYSPGLEEYAVLLALADTIDRYRNKDYIIFDTPPTALTLKFLALPDVSLLWLQELTRFRQLILDKKEIITKIKKGRKGEAVERDQILAKIESLVSNYRKLSSLLKNPGATRVFLVLNPNKLSLAESLTIRQELKGLKISIPYLILNKCGEDKAFMQILEKEFPGAKILKLYEQGEEITGLRALESLSLPLGFSEI
ncbi:MAG: AAA family ATPase [Spirochaeta sp.]|nr:AAA family ATPase [Spirochaeta sp.]